MSICRTLSFNALSHLIIHHLYTPTPPIFITRTQNKTLQDHLKLWHTGIASEQQTCDDQVSHLLQAQQPTLAFPLSLARAICVRCVISYFTNKQRVCWDFTFFFRFGGLVCRRCRFGNNALRGKFSRRPLNISSYTYPIKEEYKTQTILWH